MREWLEQIGLGRYAPLFDAHEITLDVLPELTDADINALGLPIGPRRRLIVAIRALAAPSHASTAGASRAAPPPSQPPTPDAERRQLTVMFCDLVGSTELAERLDPEELRDLMRAYRGAATSVVARYDGHVAQYLGDGLMVYFGWPVAHEDDAERGIRAALDVVEAVKVLESGPPLAVRLGVATGTVVVGDDAASGSAEARLAVGETPNMAARLQGLARANEVVIAPATRRLVGDAFELTDLGARPLKGLSEPVQAWRVESLRQTGGRFLAAHGASELSPLVGRADEMAQLAALWDLARSGAGQVVLLGGEPGIGKSRLTHALLSRVESEGAGTLLYQCSPYHLNSALHPFIAEMESASGFTSSDTPDRKLDKLETMLAGRGTVAGAAPLLAPILSLPADRYPALAISSQSRKEKTLELLAGQVEALAARRPVLVVFEDAHWIDPTSQEALELLVLHLHHVPALLIVTHRPEYAVQWPDPHPPVTIIGLSRLAPAQGAELVHRVTGGRALPRALLDRIVAQTDGVPLFVEELTKSVLESGVLRESGDGFMLDATLPSLAVPTSLRDSLLARLDRLAPVKDLVQIGACIGREFSYQLLSRITRLGDDRLQERLAQLTDSGLLFSSGSPPDARYVFKHALVQDAAYDSLLKGRRQELHARIVQVLEEDVAAGSALRPEQLAHHYTQAGNTAAAVPWWRDAGKLAVQRLGVREAVALFEKALGLLEALPASTERDGLELSIREPLNAALTGLRGWAAAEVSRNAAVILELTRRRGSQAGTGLWAIWVNTTTQGRIADSLEWAQRLVAEGEQADDLDLRILGHGASMISHFYLGQLLEARGHGNRVLELYDPAHAERWMQVTAHDLKTLVGVWSCQWTWMLGYPDQAIRLSHEKDLHARAMGEKFNLEFALTLGAYAFVYRREPERLFERLAELEALEREHSVPFMDQVMVPQLAGLARLCNGQPAEAASALARGLENWKARGGHSRVPYLKATLAEALALQNDVDAGLRLIEECLQQIEQPGWQERSHLAEVLRLKGWMLMRQNRTGDAEEALRGAIDWARQQQARSWELRAATTLAELLATRGNHAAARDLLEPIYGWFTEGFETHDLAAARARLETLGVAAPARNAAAG